MLFTKGFNSTGRYFIIILLVSVFSKVKGPAQGGTRPEELPPGEDSQPFQLYLTKKVLTIIFTVASL